eukprot:CAMPEP_0174735478 /NCGR_PEP_ID=MMETSP1094-20130205/65042_1 /TAXON_ID=156173 /ORGANISM="Chrysochromulina brevifilum, Strain UTEX LB 985" /LENGTH=253 /DNA_ID=CAMNT_0015938451 /DNA_START=80 /DNA_END=841 /DNA_ORIENTATION=+
MIARSPAFLNALKDREIDLRGNKIAVIENLAATQDQFDSIDLSDNEILKLECMAVLKRLSQLLLNNNRVTRISEGLGRALPKLQTLVLTNNQLATLTQLEPLAGCPTITNLSLVDNPVTKTKDYRAFVIALLPKLRTLDYKRVKPTERAAAEAAFRRTRAKPVRGIGSDAPAEETTAASAGVGNGVASAPKAGPTEEQVAQIKVAIANAASLEEVQRLERALKAGDFDVIAKAAKGAGGGGGGEGGGEAMSVE